MESDGGGTVAAADPTTPLRLTSQHSTLRDTFFATDIADGVHNSHNAVIANNNHNSLTRRPVSNLTLGAVLSGQRKSPRSNVIVRTLLEIIRNDETLNVGGGSPNNNKKSWKSFKERLKLKKNQNTRRWASSSPIPQSDVLPSSRSGAAMMANRSSLRSIRSSSIRRVDPVPADDMAMREVDSGGSPRSGGSFRLSAALAAEREQTRRRLSRELDEDSVNLDGDEDVEAIDLSGEKGDDDDGEDGANVDAPSNPPMMSLMDLLEETDRQAGISGPTYRLDDGEEEVEEEEEAEEEVDEEDLGKGEYSCCVCMVRHKGSAFIPCGHTFCRLCSKELFVQRGNCPLCNNFILEILDIF